MGVTIGRAFGGITVGTMVLNQRITLVSNIVAILVIAILASAIGLESWRRHEPT